MRPSQPTPPEVLVAVTGTANTASVIAAFTRLGASVRLCTDANQIATAHYVVLPGVGAFAAASSELRDSGLDVAIASRVREGLPTLAICLGMQLFCEASEESPGTRGLGLVEGTIRAYSTELCVPHMGWNQVVATGDGLLQSGMAYFANSFYLESAPAGWSGTTTSYGSTFTSAFEKGAVLACQFHPELSGDWGAQLLQRWLERSTELLSC